METIKGITYGMLSGLYDSVKGIVVVFYLDREMNKKSDDKSSDLSAQNRKMTSSSGQPMKRQEEPNIMKRVFQCCALNGGVFWLSIIVFEYGLLPTMELLLKLIFGRGSGLGSMLWSWMQPFLSLIFQMIWVLPLFLLSRIVNSLWFQDIADSAYKFRKGRPQPIPAFSKLIADTLFSILVQVLFLAQSMLVSLIPINYVGTALSFVHISLLYSLYSFEYKWYNMGWELHKRLSFIENNWPYFFGFGMPLTILTQMPNSYIVSGCVFSICFPIFILSGNEGNPFIGSCNFPLKLFSPVVALTNVFFNRSVRAPRPSQPHFVTSSARSSPMRRPSSSLSTR